MSDPSEVLIHSNQSSLKGYFCFNPSLSSANLRKRRFLDLRQSAITQIDRNELDVNMIRVKGDLLLNIMATGVEYNDMTCSISGIHFLMEAGFIPQPIGLRRYTALCLMPIPHSVASELNTIHKILKKECGLKYEALQVVLQNAELESDDILEVISKHYKTFIIDDGNV